MNQTEQKIVLETAMIECGKDLAAYHNTDPTDVCVFDVLQKTSRSSIASDLVEKLNNLGYEIKKKER